ncbi:MAG: hypothetical protein AAF065_05560 [Verrucomicrobiota bacterium]
MNGVAKPLEAAIQELPINMACRSIDAYAAFSGLILKEKRHGVQDSVAFS